MSGSSLLFCDAGRYCKIETDDLLPNVETSLDTEQFTANKDLLECRDQELYAKTRRKSTSPKLWLGSSGLRTLGPQPSIVPILPVVNNDVPTDMLQSILSLDDDEWPESHVADSYVVCPIPQDLLGGVPIKPSASPRKERIDDVPPSPSLGVAIPVQQHRSCEEDDVVTSTPSPEAAQPVAQPSGRETEIAQASLTSKGCRALAVESYESVETTASSSREVIAFSLNRAPSPRVESGWASSIPSEPKETGSNIVSIIRKEMDELYNCCISERLLKACLKESQIAEEIDRQLVNFQGDTQVTETLLKLGQDMKQELESRHVYHRLNEMSIALEKLSFSHLAATDLILGGKGSTQLPSVSSANPSIDGSVRRRVSERLKPKLSSSLQRKQPQEGEWQEQKYRNLEVLYMVDRRDHSITVRIRGKLKCQLYHVLAVLCETEVAPKWLPYLKNSKVLARCSRACQLVIQHYEYPFPIGKRESIMYGFGIDSIEENGHLMIFCVSPPVETSSYLGHKFPAKKARRTASQALWLLHPANDGDATVIEVIANTTADVKLPQGLINWLVTRIARSTYVKLAKVTVSIPGALEQMTREKPVLYNWVKQRSRAFYTEGHDVRFPKLANTTLGSFRFESEE